MKLRTLFFVIALAFAAMSTACAEGSIEDDGTVVRPEPSEDAGKTTPDADQSEDASVDACEPSPEICNGLDDDCDGIVDNDPTDAGEACEAGIGACANAGRTICESGGLVCDAVPGVVQTELCGNEIDDDCDGEVDEGYPRVGESCSVGLGVCESTGTLVCRQDGLGTECSAEEITPTDELCGDGLDNDCDGEVDEDFLIGETCTVGVGACEAVGSTVCSADALSTVCDAVAGDPGTELCGDNIDNDCNGKVDDGFETLGMACSEGVGACAATGMFTCSPDLLTLECSASAGTPQIEVCGNSVDDDCDGDTDEGFDDVGTTCSATLNTCSATGTIVCAGTTTTCDAVITPTAETCDGTDQDCDGDVDEDEICGVCADDAFEVNDFTSTSAALPRNVRHALVSCFTDPDWYTLQGLVAGETLIVNATFEDLRADLDLRLVDASGATVAGSTTSTDDEQIVFTIPTSGNYFLEVKQFGPKAVQDYTLYWSTFATAPGCTDDAWEQNDLLDEAVSLALGRTISAEICAQDADFYSIGEITRGFGIRVTLTHTAANGDLDLRLLRYGSEVASARTTGDTETIVFWPDFGGDLTVVVEGATATAANDYTLQVSFAGAFACELTGDDIASEPDDTPGTATSLPANDGRDAAICGNDDWIRMPSIQAGDDVVATLHFDGDISDLDLWIYPDAGAAGTYDFTTSVAVSRSTTDNEHVRFTAATGGDYLARIEGFGGDRGRYRFVWDSVAFTCDDAFEPNNRFNTFPSLAFQTSTRLEPSTTYTANLCAADLDNFELGRFGIGQQIQVTVTGDVADFEVELFDGLTSVVIDSGTGLTKTLTFTTTDDDDHTLAVRPLNGASVDYSVSYEVL